MDFAGTRRGEPHDRLGKLRLPVAADTGQAIDLTRAHLEVDSGEGAKLQAANAQLHLPG